MENEFNIHRMQDVSEILSEYCLGMGWAKDMWVNSVILLLIQNEKCLCANSLRYALSVFRD